MTTANTMDTTAEAGVQRNAPDARTRRNISQQERWISAGAGALLALYGLRDVTLRKIAVTGLGAMLLKRALTGRCNLYGALGISTAERGDGAAPEEYFERGIHVTESFTIQKSPEELYQFWHNFENLPRFMRHLKSVRTIDAKRSHWVVDAPMGACAEWDAEIINDEPNRLIAWRSLAGADVDNAGSVNFRPAPGERGTHVSVAIEYIPPAGKAGSMIAKLFGRDADQMIRADLRRFKDLMERSST
ncbi:MAG TPA: SRPBCC family protein [Tepidisphaeraceae bacterium]|jgi:uncharacterized membrane protein